MQVNMKKRITLNYRFTFDKGETAGEEALADLRALVKRHNKRERECAKNWNWKYEPKIKRVGVKGRCGPGGWNPRTQGSSCPPAEASRFDVYVYD